MITDLDKTTEINESQKSLSIQEIMELIPHRPPFLLIDAGRNIIQHETALGVRNIAIDEPVFTGHFPKRPVYPGVLIIESMAQTAAVLVVESLGDGAKGKLVYFMTIDNARFRKPVMPGDKLLLDVRVQRSRGPVWKFTGEAKVNRQVVAEATYSAMIMDD